MASLSFVDKSHLSGNYIKELGQSQRDKPKVTSKSSLWFSKCLHIIDSNQKFLIRIATAVKIGTYDPKIRSFQ